MKGLEPSTFCMAIPNACHRTSLARFRSPLPLAFNRSRPFQVGLPLVWEMRPERERKLRRAGEFPPMYSVCQPKDVLVAVQACVVKDPGERAGLLVRQVGAPIDEQTLVGGTGPEPRTRRCSSGAGEG